MTVFENSKAGWRIFSYSYVCVFVAIELNHQIFDFSMRQAFHPGVSVKSVISQLLARWLFDGW